MRATLLVAVLFFAPAFAAEVPWQRDALGTPDHLDGSGVVVAVMDSGVQHDHPDLEEAMWVNGGEIPDNGVDDDGNGFIDDVNGWDFCGGQPASTRPAVDHGTSVAGVVAGRGTYALGVAPGASIMDVGIICDNEDYPDEMVLLDTEALRQAIRYAVDNGANVVVMSLQNWNDDGYSLLEQLQEPEEEFQAARDAGVLIVAAAGNHGQNRISSPADQPGVFVVSGIEACGYPAWFSNRSSGVDIWAFSSYHTSKLGGANHTQHGTSFAAPQIAGLAALILQETPTATPADIEARMLRDAIDTSSGPRVNGFGMFGGALPPAPGPIKYVGATEVGRSFFLQFEGTPSTFLHLNIPGTDQEDYCVHQRVLDEHGFVIYTNRLPNPLTVSARPHDGLQAGPWHEFTVERVVGVEEGQQKPIFVNSSPSRDAPAPPVWMLFLAFAACLLRGRLA